MRRQPPRSPRRRHVHENWNGPRSTAALAAVEQRTNKPGRVFYFRLRKTFGS